MKEHSTFRLSCLFPPAILLLSGCALPTIRAVTTRVPVEKIDANRRIHSVAALLVIPSDPANTYLKTYKTIWGKTDYTCDVGAFVEDGFLQAFSQVFDRVEVVRTEESGREYPYLLKPMLAVNRLIFEQRFMRGLVAVSDVTGKVDVTSKGAVVAVFSANSSLVEVTADASNFEGMLGLSMAKATAKVSQQISHDLVLSPAMGGAPMAIEVPGAASRFADSTATMPCSIGKCYLKTTGKEVLADSFLGAVVFGAIGYGIGYIFYGLGDGSYNSPADSAAHAGEAFALVGAGAGASYGTWWGLIQSDKCWSQDCR